MANFKVGDHVMYTGRMGETYPQFYPRQGTEGVVVLVDSDILQSVQWPAGSTSENDCWRVFSDDLRPVEMMEAGG